MRKKYRIYRDAATKTWWVDSIIPGLDTFWVSDYRISPVFRGLGIPLTSPELVELFTGPRDHFRIERWDQEHNSWSLMSRAKTWLDAIRLVAYRERQVTQSTEEGHVHHLEACS